jgi:hypothetical protein
MSGTPAYLLPWYVRIPIAFRVATGYWAPIQALRAAWRRATWPSRLRSAWYVLIGKPEQQPGAPPNGPYWRMPEDPK